MKSESIIRLDGLCDAFELYVVQMFVFVVFLCRSQPRVLRRRQLGVFPRRLTEYYVRPAIPCGHFESDINIATVNDNSN